MTSPNGRGSRSWPYERGERLSRIELRTQQMEDDAANFADLAKQLAAKQKGGGWW